jgi:hypothetical protein
MTASRSILKMFSVLFVAVFMLAGVLPARAEESTGTLAASANFLWAGRMGGTGDDGGNSIILDASGNVYTTGQFIGTADFDPGAGIFNLTTAENVYESFISKVDGSGNLMWAKRIGGTGHTLGLSIFVDPAGNVYTTGQFGGSVDFDPGVGTYNLTASGPYPEDRDVFISKLNSNGEFIWAKSMGGNSTDESLDITVDTGGNVYITGEFLGTADFDPGVGAYDMTSAGSFDLFLSKLDSNGSFVWAKRMGSTKQDYSYSIALDANGNVYTTGQFGGTVDFDPGAGVYNLTSSDYFDVFVSKLDSNGNFLFARNIGGAAGAVSVGQGIVVDLDGNIYTTGGFFGTVDFDPGVNTYNLTNIGNSDIFISKLDSSGNFVWAKRMGGMNSESGLSLAVDASGNVYVTGQFRGTSDFDPGAGVYSLTSNGLADIFVSKLDHDGNFAWAKSIGGIYNDEGVGIASDSSNNVFVTGSFQLTADFDTGSGTTNLTSAGGFDIFIARFQNGGIFEDVPLGYWARDFIERLYAVGITGGCNTSPLQYCPEGTVTRAQMAVFLLRGIHTSFYTPPAIGAGSGFGDVPIDYWSGA